MINLIPESPRASDTLLEQTRQERFVRRVILVTMAVLVLFFLLYVGMALSISNFPHLLIVTDALSIVVTVILLSITRQAMHRLAAIVYAVMATIVLLITMYFMNGPIGPMALGLPVLSLIVGAMLGRRAAIISISVNSVIYCGWMFLESFGMFVVPPFPFELTPFLWVGIFVTASTVLIIINEQFVGFMGDSMAILTQRSRDLAVANQRAQAAVEAERRLRQHDIEMSQQFDNTLKQYVAFLERVRVGDYTSRLDLLQLAENKNLPLELINLGRYLNATVESLVAALTDVQAVQQTYVKQSWETLAEAAALPEGYYYRDGAVEAAEGAWLEPMTQAIRTRELTVDERKLAIPLNIRGQIIGAMGVRREAHDPWSREELEIVNEVADQLAQTIENLRLLDDTNRRAAREEAVGDITAKIRTEVEIEAVLERALVELGRVLQADRGSAHLALRQSQEESQ
ncbi:MAG: GAF domain-containing protein [Anaerolineae bacterium]|nr:GAF domain-containing protein [Anaerolineae bacterium]